MLRVLLLNVASSVAFYTAFVYVITYIQSEAGQSESVAWPEHPSDGIAADLLPNRRLVSDRLGRRPLLITDHCFCCSPACRFLNCCTAAIPPGSPGGSAADVGGGAAGWSQKPSQCRIDAASGALHGLGPCFNVAEGYFGGTTSLIASWLVSSSGNPLLPGIGLPSLEPSP